MGFRMAVSDTLVLSRRNFMRIVRAPDLLLAFTVQPIMFVLLFAYVFGGAIPTPGHSYIDFLIPGILVQTMSFGGFVTAMGIAEDLRKGLIDRFRSLPMARSAVLAGRTLSDIATNAISIAVMLIVGIIIGFGFSTPFLHVVLGILILLLFGYAFSWVFAFIGLTSSSPEAAQSLGFILIFPLTFISSAFVPPETMPAALQWFAEWNPFSITVNAIRALFIGDPAGNTVWGAIAWSIGIATVFAILAVTKYKRAVVR
jgi:ABC-2 type transport system permease protein/oleandomycin transport system permease protein